MRREGDGFALYDVDDSWASSQTHFVGYAIQVDGSVGGDDVVFDVREVTKEVKEVAVGSVDVQVSGQQSSPRADGEYRGPR